MRFYYEWFWHDMISSCDSVRTVISAQCMHICVHMHLFPINPSRTFYLQNYSCIRLGKHLWSVCLIIAKQHRVVIIFTLMTMRDINSCWCCTAVSVWSVYTMWIWPVSGYSLHVQLLLILLTITGGVISHGRVVVFIMVMMIHVYFRHNSIVYVHTKKVLIWKCTRHALKALNSDWLLDLHK